MIIAKIIGKRLRSYRNQKNIESISKVAAALGVSLSTLFENISTYDTDDIPPKCYELVQKQSIKDQKYLLEILDAIVNYKES